MARRTDPLPAFPRELANLGWTLIKAQGVNAVRAVNSRLHCTSPNFASDGRRWAQKKAERAAAKGVVAEPPQVRAEIVEWARRMTGIAIPLIAALDRAVPDGEEAPRPFLFWSVTTTGPGGAAIEVSAGYTRWFLQPSGAGWLLFPPPPREPPPLWVPEQAMATVWALLAAHDERGRARGIGTTTRENQELFSHVQALVRAWALAHDPELAAWSPNRTGNAMTYTSPTRIALDGLRALLTLPPGDVDGPLLRDLLAISGREGEAVLLERARARGPAATILVERAAAALTPDALLDAAAWADMLPEAEQRLLRSAVAPWLMRHSLYVDAAQRLLLQIEEEAETANALNHSAEHVPDRLLRSWIDVARTWADPAQGRAMVALLRALAQRGPEAARQALSDVEIIRLPFPRALALALILTHLTGIEPISATAHELRRQVVELSVDERDGLAELIVVPFAESGLAATAIDLAGRCGAAVRDDLLLRIADVLREREPAQALVAARQVADLQQRAETALRVAQHMPPIERPAAFDVAFSAACEVTGVGARARLLLAVAQGMTALEARTVAELEG